MSLEKTFELLGGLRALGTRVGSSLEFVPLLHAGLPWQSFERTTRALELTPDEVSESLQIPKRTLARRKKQAKRLTTGESERLLRLARVGTRARDVFKSDEKGLRWLKSPCRALGGRTPLSLLDTDIGTQAAEDVLGRVEYGVYS